MPYDIMYDIFPPLPEKSEYVQRKQFFSFYSNMNCFIFTVYFKLIQKYKMHFYHSNNFPKKTWNTVPS